MGTRLIVSLQHSGWIDDVQHVLLMIAKGESFGIWHGRWNEKPRTWRDGSAALRLKVGKRRRLIKGRLTFEYEGRGPGENQLLTVTCHGCGYQWTEPCEEEPS